MGRKLTTSEREQKVIKKIIHRLLTIENQYGVRLTRLACQRHAMKRREEHMLKQQIDSKEKELRRLKNSIGDKK